MKATVRSIERLQSLHARIDVRQVVVDDPFIDAQERKVIAREIKNLERLVGDVERGMTNVGADQFWSASHCMREWRESIPSAIALFPLYDVRRRLASGRELDAFTQSYFRHCLDAIGIRSRAATMAHILSERLASTGGRIRSLSLASGAADPVFDMAQDLLDRGTEVEIHLVDQDRKALAVAHETGIERGFADRVRVQRANILKLDKVRDRLEASHFEAVDILGFFEYLPRMGERPGRIGAVEFLKAAWELVAPGGTLVFSNMRDDRDELVFNLHVIQWPLIIPRSIAEVVEIARAAGIPLQDVTIYLPMDGVYTVVAATRKSRSLRVATGRFKDRSGEPLEPSWQGSRAPPSAR